jgi:hypothetical protein
MVIPGQLPARYIKDDAVFKLPFNELLAGLSAKQDKFDKAVAQENLLKTLVPEGGLQTSGKIRSSVLADLEADAAPLREKLYKTGEVSPYEFEAIGKKYANDPRMTWLKQDAAMLAEANKKIAEGDFNYGLQNWYKDGQPRDLGWDGKTMFDPTTGEKIGSIGEAYRFIAPENYQAEFTNILKNSIIPTITNKSSDEITQQIITLPDGSVKYRVRTLDGTKTEDFSVDEIRRKLTEKVGSSTLADQIFQSLPGNKVGPYYLELRKQQLGQKVNTETFTEDFISSIFGLTYKKEEKKESTNFFSPATEGAGSGETKTAKPGTVPLAYPTLTGTSYKDLSGNPITSASQLSSVVRTGPETLKNTMSTVEKTFNEEYGAHNLKVSKIIDPLTGGEIFEIVPIDNNQPLNSKIVEEAKNKLNPSNTEIQTQRVLLDKATNIQNFFLQKFPNIEANSDVIYAETLEKVKGSLDNKYKVRTEARNQAIKSLEEIIESEAQELINQGVETDLLVAKSKVRPKYYLKTGNKQTNTPTQTGKSYIDNSVNTFMQDEAFVNNEFTKLAQEEIINHPQMKGFKEGMEEYLTSLERENLEGIPLVGLDPEGQMNIGVNIKAFLSTTSDWGNIRFTDKQGVLLDESNQTLREELQKYMSEISPNDFMVKNSVFIRPIDASGQPVIDFTYTDKEGKNHKVELPTNLVMGAQGDALMDNLNKEFQLLNKAQFGKGYFAQMQQFGASTIIPGVTIHELPAEIKVNGINLGADEKIVTINNKAYRMKSYDDMVTLHTRLTELKKQGLTADEAKLFADTYLSSGGFEAVPGLDKYLQRGVKPPALINFQ